ncbi:hypothetical protein LZ31DRAFT_559231 [Colletotrichum somersetense]|nr:hypothetical protein LZ31DRAFT_559231 [Colletotrichum somersetense]
MKKNAADGFFTWGAWPERPKGISEDIDASFVEFLGRYASDNKRFNITNVLPWFYINLLGYRKNCFWRGNSIWVRRWSHVWLVQPDCFLIITISTIPTSDPWLPSIRRGAPQLRSWHATRRLPYALAHRHRYAQGWRDVSA